MAAPAPYLSGERLRALLPPAEALAAVQSFFATQRREAVAVPARIHLPVPGTGTTGLYMPAANADFVALKVVHLMPQRLPSVQAEVFLYEAATGRLLCWGDGKPLTGLRTAAVSCAATLRLLPRCRSLLLYGAGVQAAAHVVAFAAAYPELEQAWAATRSPASYERLRAALPAALGARLRPCPQPADVLGTVDCVVTTTPAPQPLFEWERLAPRAHVVGIGSATHAMNELPPEAFLHGQVWLDTRNAIAEAGDLRAALARGWDASRVAGDLFDLLAPGAAAPAAEGAAGRTVFKSVGHAAQDLAVLIRLWERLQAAGG
jgi:1-piperideine-2-carboxylate/1-pyrroline-2-carboxylate reductase [NAD(P)H]